jgi:SAM-dependent methyltransferase
MSLPALPKGTLDYVVAFDVFVHFEPRLVYWYLRQIRDLLKPGGIGVIHYANALTPIGWRQFMADLDENVKRRIHFAAFGVMCPQLMEQFLRVLGLEIVSIDTQIIPRDAVAVFRAPGV